MKKIITAVDFSENSINAAYYAANMAGALGYDLLVVHVCINFVGVSEVPMTIYTTQELMDNAEQQMNQLLDRMNTLTSGKVKISGIIRQGGVIEELQQCCRENETYAMVMGRGEMSSLERLILGSRTADSIKKLSCPVIVVPSGARFKGIRNVGIACDFRDVIETLPVSEIKELVKDLKAHLHVLHVSSVSDQDFDARTIEESGWFQDLMADVKLNYHFINEKDTEAGIIDFADKHSLDLLIVIPKKHTLITKLLKHSHSRQLVLHAHVPVMAIH